MTSSLRGNCNMIYSNEFFVVNKLLKKCWQHAYNHISPFYILECFMLWFGWQTTRSNHYVTRDLRASVLFIACLSPFLGCVNLPFLDLVISPTFTIVILWLSQIHKFQQWDHMRSCAFSNEKPDTLWKMKKKITLSIKHDIGDKKVKHVHFGENI